MTSGLAAVQARIAQIQGSFQTSGLAVVRETSVRTATPPATTGSFSSALAQVSAPAAPPAPAAATPPATARARATGPAGATSAPSAPAPHAGVSGTDVVASARRFLGVPYKWGGTNPATGLDCSGLVQKAYGDLGIDLPRVSRDQAKAGRPVASLAEARPGDLIAFGRPVDHIGIYVGDGKMLAAPRRGDVVKIQDVYRTPTAIRRVLPDQGAPAAAPAVAAASTRPAGSPSAREAAYAPLFAAAGAKHGVSPALLTAVARAESGFDPAARSPAGARGLMQFMPGTARELGIDPMQPEQAVDGAARLLKQHLSRFGSTELALAAYNAGPGAVTKHGGIPPYRETQDYVRKIMSELRAEAA